MSFNTVKDIDCVVVGYAGVDRIIRLADPAEKGKTSLVLNKNNREITYGGNGSNVAVCMAKLGCRVLPLMRVGGDWEQLGYKSMLESSGVCLEGITVVENETTSICHLLTNRAGEHMTLTYPGAMDSKYATGSWDETIFHRAKYSLVTVATRQDVERFVELSEKYKLPLVFGIRVDLECFPLRLFEKILLNSEIVFMNEVEYSFIKNKICDLKSIFDNGKAKHVVVTQGSGGSDVYVRCEFGFKRVHVNAVHCDEIVDTTGAGDSYIAGYMYAYLKGYGAEICAVYASCEASFVIGRLGCTVGAPTEIELLEKAKYVIEERQ